MSIQISASPKPLFQVGNECQNQGHDWSLPTLRGGGVPQVTKTCRRCGQTESRTETEYDMERQMVFF